MAIAIRVVKSYKYLNIAGYSILSTYHHLCRLMLDFYGLVLVNELTGEIERGEHWKERYNNLNRSHHNFLRISVLF